MVNSFELDMYPMIGNRDIILLKPTKLYLDWVNYINDTGKNLSQMDIDTITFLIPNFEKRQDFEDWIEVNYGLIFEIRLNYFCIDRSKWRENRTLSLFKSWFDLSYSNLILDLGHDTISII